MGFGNRGGGGPVTWFYISKGKFITGKNEDKAEYEVIDGTLTKIEFEDAEGFEGKKIRRLIMTLVDGDLTMKLGTDTAQGYGQQILKKLPNADLSKPIEISLSYDPVTKKSGAFLRQGSNNLKQFWTKENPGELPQCETQQFGGKTLYDWSKQEAYLEDYILKHVASKIDSTAKSGSSESSEGEDGENVPF